MRTKYIPEILTDFEKLKSKEDKQQAIAEFRRVPALIALIKLAYGDGESVFSKSDITKLLKEDHVEPAEEYTLNASHLFGEYRRVNLFFNHAPELERERLEKLFVQMRESIHANEFALVVKVLKKQNLAKGLTEKAIREVFPKLLPALPEGE